MKIRFNDDTEEIFYTRDGVAAFVVMVLLAAVLILA